MGRGPWPTAHIQGVRELVAVGSHIGFREEADLKVASHSKEETRETPQESGGCSKAMGRVGDQTLTSSLSHRDRQSSHLDQHWNSNQRSCNDQPVSRDGRTSFIHPHTHVVGGRTCRGREGVGNWPEVEAFSGRINNSTVKPERRIWQSRIR